MKKLSRRDVLKVSGAATIGMAVSPLKTIASQKIPGKLKIIVIGAHPDDPETGCGGTIALLTKQDHEVVSAYLTRGEAGIQGKTYDEAAQIRTSEAKEACKILNAQAVFLSQIDGNTEITPARYKEMFEFLNSENPDIVFTHWPIDTHRDHRICSNLVYDAWLHLEKNFSLYYFEVMSGEQSQNFYPTDYVDISATINLKHKASFAHKSQNIEEMYGSSHARMEVFRGMEAGYKYAEAFIRQNQNPKQHIL